MCNSNYVPYHVHSDLSNGVTNIDSVTKFHQYIERAKEFGMTAMGFAEHGCVFEWAHKKEMIEAAGMKYIHAVEVYVTYEIVPDNLVRDNMHCVLIALDYEGVKEINRLVSKSFNREDGHFYYTPRITFDELKSTSGHIVVTSACTGGLFAKATGEQFNEILNFFIKNKDRCYLEVQHHLDPQQVQYNQALYRLSMQYKIPLIAGTDTHCLNEEHERGRSILQKSKNILFGEESLWDLKFKTFEELVESFKNQRALPEKVYLQAIANTTAMAERVKEFSLDTSYKYPHLYENPEAVLRQKVEEAISNHPYAIERHGVEALNARVNEEIDTMCSTGAASYMLLQDYLRQWEKSQGITCGPGRGSVSGSMVAYLLGITKMDSMKFGLNFTRFMNSERVSLADIDTDYSPKDRDAVKLFLLRDHLGLEHVQTCEIITFNTIAEKGAVVDVGRALGIPLEEVRKISKLCEAEKAPRDEYPELFEYVDIVNGTIVSIGSHPSGVLITDREIESEIGTCTTKGSDYPVSMLNMKELDGLNFVKLDILGLANVGLINETCRIAGIDIMTPDNTDFEDMDVWRAIRNDTTAIFQFESQSAAAYLRQFMSDKTLEKVSKRVDGFSMLKWMSFANGLLRPACASYRNKVADGEFHDNGMKELNDFLAPTLGYLCMQEDIIKWCVEFCGYTMGAADNVRRAIAKKKGTETLIPQIRSDFIEHTSKRYGYTVDECEAVIDQFLQVIQDASSYAFSWNHSDSYSVIGYICGYLRYHYPYEFITAALNIFADKEDKTSEIIAYANKQRIKITPPKYGVSRADYAFSQEMQTVAKGLFSVKYLSSAIAEEIFEMSQTAHYETFIELAAAIINTTSTNTRQLDVLIKIGYFSDYGNINELLEIVEWLETLKYGAAKSIDRDAAKKMPCDPTPFVCGVRKDGKEASRLTIVDLPGLAEAIEKGIFEKQIPEPSWRERAEYSKEFMGYIDLTTNKKEDRRRVYVLNIFEIKNRFQGGVWKYRVDIKSVGTGRTSSVSVTPYMMRTKPFDVGSILYAAVLHQDDKGYWNMHDYDVLE